MHSQAGFELLSNIDKDSQTISAFKGKKLKEGVGLKRKIA
jgi:hypothetical protein